MGHGRTSPTNNKKRINLRNRIKRRSPITSSKISDANSVSNRITLRNSRRAGSRINSGNNANSRITLQNSNRPRDNRISSASTNSSNKPEANRTSNANNVSSNRLAGSRTSSGNSNSSKPIPPDSNSKPEASRINSDNSVSSNSSKPTQLDSNSSRLEGRISNVNSVNNRTIDTLNNGTLLKFANSRLPGKVLVHIAGSRSTAPGSNAAVTAVIVFPRTVSVATTDRITLSVSTTYQ